MIPTRAFQKIGKTRVIGFDPTLAAFSVVRDHSLILIHFSRRNRKFSELEPVYVESDSDQMIKWNNPTPVFSLKYRNEFDRYITLSCKTGIGIFIKRLWIESGDEVDPYYVHSTGGIHFCLATAKYVVKVDYGVIKFQEFV